MVIAFAFDIYSIFSIIIFISALTTLINSYLIIFNLNCVNYGCFSLRFGV